eukprot:10014547-Karenia_brevis.AAC.1
MATKLPATISLQKKKCRWLKKWAGLSRRMTPQSPTTNSLAKQCAMRVLLLKKRRGPTSLKQNRRTRSSA